MIKQHFPAYLRLHTEGEAPTIEPAAKDLNIDLLCQKFAAVTGAQLEYGPPAQLPLETDWCMEIEGVRGGDPMALAIHASRHTDKATSEHGQDIEHLAGEIGWLIDRLHQTERALWEREGELAVGIPVTAHPDTDGPGIAERLEAILRGGTLAVDGSAAALYMLDETTTRLKLRSHWGLSDTSFLDAPRMLRGARADLEALAGHAVVIESKDELDHWGIPEPFIAAVCIPVSTMTMPLGTLWIFSEQERDFNDNQTNLIEIVAGRIAVELEREVLIGEYCSRQPLLGCEDREMSAALADQHRRPDPQRGWDKAVAWQQQLLPAHPPYADGWDFAGCARYAHSLHGDHCFWHTCADGRVFASLGSVFGDGPQAAMTSSFVAGAIRGDCGRSDLGETLSRVNRALWISSNGDQLASIFACHVDPSTGQVRFAATGDSQVFVIRPHGWEPFHTALEHCGSDETIAVPVATQYLEPDDILIAIASPARLTPRAATALTTQPQRLAEVALHHNHLAGTQLVELLRDQWSACDAHDVSPPAILVVKRNR